MAMLKGLVIVLGALILAAIGVIAVTVANRMSKHEPPAAPVASGAAPFGTVHVALPAGARVIESHVDGGRLVLRVARADGPAQILVYDLATGRALGTIELDAGR